MPDLKRPILAVSGYILDAEDPELRTLELAQRFFERHVGARGASEEDICNTLVWLAGTRVQLHNAKGAMHTLAHLRARSRGRFRDLENLASLLEILLHLEMREYRQGMGRLDLLRMDGGDDRTRARLTALRHQLRGRFLSAQGQLKLAHEEFERAIQVLRVGPAQIEDLAIMAELYNDQGQALYREGRGDEGLKVYAQSETVSKHVGFQLAEARSLRGRGSIFAARKETNEAIKYFKAALDIFQKYDSPYGILRSSISLGRAHYSAADLRQALFYFEEARIQCGKGRYPNEEAEVNARIGDIMLSEGQYEKAAEFYEQDLQISSVHGTERSRAHALRNVGRIQRLLGNFLRAEACLDESSALFSRLGDRVGLTQTLQQMVQCYLEQGKTPQARQALEVLKENVERLGRPYEQGLARMLEGIVMRHEGLPTEARQMLDQSLRTLSKEPGFFTVMCQVELAQAHFELGEKDLSVHQFREGITMARRLKHHDIEKRALDLLAKVDRGEWARILHSGGGEAANQGRRAARVLLSVMSCDLRGGASLYSLEPEESASLVNRYYETMATIMARKKGILNKILGERMLAVFGLDSTCDPTLALECAEACQEAFARLQADNPRYAALGLACAVATGQSIHGMLGSTDRVEYSVAGAPLNTVDRLLAWAETGEILICQDTHRAVRHSLVTSSPRDIEARSNETKIVAYQVASPRVTSRPGPAR